MEFWDIQGLCRCLRCNSKSFISQSHRVIGQPVPQDHCPRGVRGVRYSKIYFLLTICDLMDDAKVLMDATP